MKRNKIIITGCSGFIGSHLVRCLAPYHEVIGIDLQNFNRYGDMDLLSEFYRESYDSVDVPDFKDIDLVIHLACNPNIPVLETYVSRATEDITSFQSLIEWCQQNKVKKFIFASSVAVFGNGDGPISNYGMMKLFQEKLLRSSGIDHAILRLANVYGPDNNKGVIHDMIRDAFEKREIIIHGTGMQSRSFLHVHDLCLSIQSLIENFQTGTISLGGYYTTVLDIARYIKYEFEKIGDQVKISNLNKRPFDIYSSFIMTEDQVRLSRALPKNLFEEITRLIRDEK